MPLRPPVASRWLTYDASVHSWSDWRPMDRHAMTFDFQNTLAACPEWFELEVRHLHSEFLRWRSERDGQVMAPVLLEESDSRYRQLRQEIIGHGNELTAEACLD